MHMEYTQITYWKGRCHENKGVHIREWFTTRALLDYDNLQQKQTLDTVALYVMFDVHGKLILPCFMTADFYVMSTTPWSGVKRTVPASTSWRRIALESGSWNGKSS